jgi:hypothetical protein
MFTIALQSADEGSGRLALVSTTTGAAGTARGDETMRSSANASVEPSRGRALREFSPALPAAVIIQDNACVALIFFL